MHQTHSPIETRPLDPFNWLGKTIAGQYAIEAVAGEGGYGIVYRALHLALEVPVAVKCLKLPPYLDERARATFLTRMRTEARILHRLSRRHAGIAQALDIGAVDSPAGPFTPYLVMEWLDGDTLERYLAEQGRAGQPPGGIGSSSDILSSAAQALTVAHEEGVSHLDLKPSNLIFTRSGAGQTLKILDFGVAAAFAHTETVTSLGKNRTAFSPAYGAPEQFDATHGTSGPATDVFAMALILVEIATGRRVLEGQDLVQLYFASRDAASRTRVDGGPRVEAVIRKALDPRPERRFPSIGEMWSALLEARHEATTHLSKQTGPNAHIDAITPTEGEHRACTVLTLDLTWLHAYSANVDAEEIKESIDLFLRKVADIVEELGGVVETSVGERVIAAFGIPQASDRDAERAVTAALRIASMFSSTSLWRAIRVEKPSSRIGVGTGRAFVEFASRSTNSAVRIVGDAVRIARSMEDCAPAGAIAISPETYRRLIGLFNVAPLYTDSTKGGSDSPDGYRVVSAVPLRVPVTACDFRGMPTRVFGREAERQRLLDALETVLSEKTAHRITLVGPPGIGRSRMLTEFVNTLVHRDETFLVLLGQGSPLAQNTSYGLAAAMLRRRFGVREQDTFAGARRKLAAGLRLLRMKGRSTNGRSSLSRDDTEIQADLNALLDDLEIVIGLRAPRAPIGGASPSDDLARTEKTRILASMVRLCRFAASTLPVVVICDDMQWADDSSLDLFDALLSGVDDLPLLFVTATRPEVFERRPAMREDTSGLHSIMNLPPLPRRHLEDIVRDRLSRVADMPADLVNDLGVRAEGNPLLLEEMLHLLLDVGAIDTTDADSWLVRDNYRDALALPATVQGIIHARLDKLAVESRTVLSRAAIVGRTFWEGLVEHLTRAEHDRMDVHAIVSDLRRKQIVKSRETASVPGEREFMFVEATTHEVAYEVLRARVRRRLHLQVAQWLEARVPGGDGAAVVAQHYDRGGDVARAVTAYLRAAGHAAALGEHEGAGRFLMRASELLRQPPPTTLGETSGEGERRVGEIPERIRVEHELAAALRRLGRLDEALEACDRAMGLLDQDERRAQSLWDNTERKQWRARIDYNIALIRRVQGQTAEGMACVERAISLALDMGMDEEVPPMYALLSFLHRRQGRPDEAIRTARRGLKVCRKLPQDMARRGELIAHLMLGVAVGYYSQKRWLASERCYRIAARAVSESAHPHLAGVAWNGVAGALNGRGEVAAARDMLLRSLRLKERAGDLHQILVANSNMAEVELRLGRPREALAHAKRAVQMGEKAGIESDLADMYKNVADASLALGDIEGALEAGKRAVVIAANSGRVYLADAIASLGRAITKAEADEKSEWSHLIEKAKTVVAEHRGDKL